MHTLPVTLRRIVGCSFVGAIAVPVLAGGCSSSNGSGPTTAVDASADQTSAMSSSSASSGQDASGPHTSVQDSSQPDTSSSMDASDSGHDATSTDAADASDAANDSDASDASDAANDASDTGVPACTTTIALLGGGDGGVNDAGDAGVAPMILFDFDTSVDAGDTGFQTFDDNQMFSTSTLAVTSTDGYPCAGALEMNVTYTGFGGTSGDQIYYGFSSPQDWTGYTELHAWIKVVTSDFTTILGVEPSVQSFDFNDTLFCDFVSGSTLSGAGTADGWQEVVVPLNPAAATCSTSSSTYVPGMVNAIEFNLQTLRASEDGSAAPPPATMLVDSIWLQ